MGEGAGEGAGTAALPVTSWARPGRSCTVLAPLAPLRPLLERACGGARAVFNFAADCVLGRWVTIYHHAYHTARAFRVPVPSAPVVVPAPGAARHAMRARARQLSGRWRPRPTSRTRPTSTMARPCAGRAAPLLQLRFASAAAAAARNHDRLRETTCVREQTHASDGWAAFRCITHPLPYPSPRSARPTMTPAAAADRTRAALTCGASAAFLVPFRLHFLGGGMT